MVKTLLKEKRPFFYPLRIYTKYCTLPFSSSGLKLPVLDKASDAYFTDAITSAGVTYATCRVINASVSIIKESSLNLEPAGVGLTFAIGQALDPIDDMTERVSDVLVTAITSLGVQKMAYEISVSLAPPILAIFLLILSIVIWFENERLIIIRKTIIKFILLLIIARFALPISAITNNYIQKHIFLMKKYRMQRKNYHSGLRILIN